MPISPLVDQAIAAIGPLDAAAVAAAEARQGVLTKPPGSLGRLESLSIQLAGILGQPIPQITGKAVIVVAGDHGVAAEGVSAFPAEVTPQMVFNFVAGGAAINALARHAGANITVIDAGVAVDLDPQPGLTIAKVGYGAANIARGPAMSREDAVRCLEIGIHAANAQADAGANLIAGGDMGIGNTTPSAAITAAVTGADVGLCHRPGHRRRRRRPGGQDRHHPARAGGQPTRRQRWDGCAHQGGRLRDRRAGRRHAGRGRAQLRRRGRRVH